MIEWRWKLPASSRYSFLGEQKGLISEEIKPFIMRLVEISGIEPLTFPAVNAGKPPSAAMIEMQEVSGVRTANFTI